ncbi:hypothetical protein RJ639_012519, partial [Escallonia herrerae]
MMFLLTALRISYILDLDMPPPPKEPRNSAESVSLDAKEVEHVKKERKKREGDKNNNVINKYPFGLSLEDYPKSFKDAMSSRDAPFSKEAIDDEMDSITSKDTL